MERPARPTVTGVLDDGRAVRVWTGMGKGGVRWFRVWASRLAGVDGGVVRHAVETASVRKAAPVGTEAFSGEAWARVVGSDARGGTLYEVEYVDRPNPDTVSGHRVLIERAARGGWRYVGCLGGDYADDTGALARVTVDGHWNEQTGELMEVEVRRVEDRDEVVSGRCEVRVVAVMRFAVVGRVEEAKPTEEREWLEVQAGNTFSGLMEGLAEMDGRWDGRGAAALGRRVRGMNPGLEVGRLRVGQRVMVPTLAERERVMRR